MIYQNRLENIYIIRQKPGFSHTKFIDIFLVFTVHTIFFNYKKNNYMPKLDKYVTILFQKIY